MDGTGPRSTGEIVQLMVDVARGLNAIHEAQIVHRDLKPSNILIDQLTGKAKIADFGLARDALQVSDATRSSIVGTPSYMSPEQITNPQSVDSKSDIFSFGTILYELLAGERPFRGANDLLVQHKIVHVDPAQPSTFNDGIPRDLETIAMKCLAKEPNYRYQSVSSLLDDLENFQNHRPILARPASLFQKLKLKCKRYPQQAVLAGLLLLTVLASFLVVTSLWRSAVHRREQLAESIRQMEFQREKSEHNYRIACDILEKLVLLQIDMQGLDIALFTPEQLDPIRRGQEMLISRIEENSRSVKSETTPFSSKLTYVRTIRQLADTNFSLGDRDGAKKGYEQALEMLNRMSEEGDTRNEIASVIEGLASTEGDRDKAKALLLSAIDQRRQIVRDSPENNLFLDDLVKVELRAAGVFLQDSDRDSALRYYEYVCEHSIKQLAVEPTAIRFETLMSVSLMLAGQYRINGDPDRAALLIDQVLELQSQCDTVLSSGNLRFNCNLMCLLRSKIHIEKEDWLHASRDYRRYMALTSVETLAHPDHYDIVNQFIESPTVQHKIETGLRETIQNSESQTERAALEEELQYLLAGKP
jgi:tetratricopeptide (TPR) repeat protein